MNLAEGICAYCRRPYTYGTLLLCFIDDFAAVLCKDCAATLVERVK